TCRAARGRMASIACSKSCASTKPPKYGAASCETPFATANPPRSARSTNSHDGALTCSRRSSSATVSRSGKAASSSRRAATARRRELRESGARVIVDATHPFAEEISRQLIALARELGIAYLRYERPTGAHNGDGSEFTAIVRCATFEHAATQAIARGTRIFLA